MFDLALYAELKRLLDSLAEAEDRLTPNEIETYRSIALKYADPATPDHNDVTCLEVILPAA